MHPEPVRRHGTSPRPLMAWARRLLRRVAATIRECQQARYRATVFQFSPDRLLPDPDRAPDTYAEFLFRISGPALPEPPARARPGGQAPGISRRRHRS